MKKFHIVVLGCQMNYADSARIKAVLSNCGRERVESIDEADVVIFDTCSVRQKSEDKIFGTLLEVSKEKKVWLTGCMVQHYLKHGKITKQKAKRASVEKKRMSLVATQSDNLLLDGELAAKDDESSKQISPALRFGNFLGAVKTMQPTILGRDGVDVEGYKTFSSPTNDYLFVNHAFDPLYKKLISKFPNVELLFRIDDVGMMPYVLHALGYDVAENVESINEYTGIIPQGTNQLMLEHSKTAYVPISVGCSQFCAYCIVPYARGLEKYRERADIIKEVKQHLAAGIQEIVLLGQIVNKHPQFVDILKEILALPGLVWLRYTSPYPTYYSQDLLHLHETEEKLCPHIHMPLQSGSSAVLKKMFRGYTAEEFAGFVDAIRALKRPISITTDIIIGYCDETEEDFQQSLDMIRYAKFDMIYMGLYSPRPGTYAYKRLHDNVPAKVKTERRQRMNALLRETSAQNNRQELGTTRFMMINHLENSFFSGYTDNMKTVIVKRGGAGSPHDNNIILGSLVKVKITEANILRLSGELVQE